MLNIGAEDSERKAHLWKDEKEYYINVCPPLVGAFAGCSTDLRSVVQRLGGAYLRKDYEIIIGQRPDGSEAPLNALERWRVRRHFAKIVRKYSDSFEQ